MMGDIRRPARSFRDLIVWQKAHEMVLGIYRMTRGFPAEERYGLTSQARRAAVSTPANIAEGFGKRTKTDKRRFLSIAQGSLEETRYYLILADDLGYAGTEQLMQQVEEVSRLLVAADRSLGSDDRIY